MKSIENRGRSPLRTPRRRKGRCTQQQRLFHAASISFAAGLNPDASLFRIGIGRAHPRMARAQICKFIENLLTTNAKQV
jgi:hypothetical protein